MLTVGLGEGQIVLVLERKEVEDHSGMIPPSSSGGSERRLGMLLQQEFHFTGDQYSVNSCNTITIPNTATHVPLASS